MSRKDLLGVQGIGGPGRPKGIPECGHIDTSGKCGKMAAVVVTMEVTSGATLIPIRKVVFRCLRHYVILENAARNSTIFRVTDSRMIEKKRRRIQRL